MTANPQSRIMNYDIEGTNCTGAVSKRHSRRKLAHSRKLDAGTGNFASLFYNMGLMWSEGPFSFFGGL